MSEGPYKETERHRYRNRDAERDMSVKQAILVDGKEGVAVFLGAYQTCLTEEGAIRLAQGLVKAIDRNKTER